MVGMVVVDWGIMVCCDVVVWKLRERFQFSSSRPFDEVFLGYCFALWMIFWRCRRWLERTLIVLSIRFWSLYDRLERRRSFFFWMVFGNALAMIETNL